MLLGFWSLQVIRKHINMSWLICKAEKDTNYQFLANFLSVFAGDLPKQLETEDPLSKALIHAVVNQGSLVLGYTHMWKKNLHACAGSFAAHLPEIWPQSTFSTRSAWGGWDLPCLLFWWLIIYLAVLWLAWLIWFYRLCISLPQFIEIDRCFIR